MVKYISKKELMCQVHVKIWWNIELHNSELSLSVYFVFHYFLCTPKAFWHSSGTQIAHIYEKLITHYQCERLAQVSFSPTVASDGD
jgi:hypothetical protein